MPIVLMLLVLSGFQVWSILRFRKQVGRTRIEFVLWTGVATIAAIAWGRAELWSLPLLWVIATILAFSSSVDAWMD